MTREEKLAQLEKLQATYADLEIQVQQRDMDNASDAELLQGQEDAKKREQLDSLQAKYQQLQEVGKPEIPVTGGEMLNSEDSDLDNVLDVVGEIGAAGNRSLVDLTDFVLSPWYGTLRVRAALAGDDDYEPTTLRQKLHKEGASVEGGYMEAGTARDAVQGLGYVLPMTMGFINVVRPAGSVSSAMQDMLGIGMSKADDATLLAEQTARALKDVDTFKLALPETEEQIFSAAQDAYNNRLVEANRPFFAEAEQRAKDIAKQLEKEAAGKLKEGEEMLAPIEPIEPRLVQFVVKDLKEMGVPEDAILNTIATRPLKFTGTIDDLMEMDNNSLRFTNDVKANTTDPSWLAKTLLPVADLLRERVSPTVGNLFERASESSMRKSTGIIQNIGNPIRNVVKYIDDNPALKRDMLDLWIDPAKIQNVRKAIQKELAPEDLKAFDNFVTFSQSRNRAAQQKLYKDVGFDDIYIHTEVRPSKSIMGSFKESLGRFGSNETEKPDFLQQRVRKPAYLMDDVELSEYENPLLSHMKFMVDQEVLLEIADKFKIRPSMALDSNVDALFKEVQRKLVANGMNANRAEGAAEVMRQAYLGGKQAPPPVVRAFMAQSYLGTLTQLKTAVLNLHDVAVSMVNNGVRPTLGALIASTKGEFGKNLTALGIGDNQSVGEFVRNFDQYTSSPEIWEKVARGVDKASEVGFAISGFRAMDRFGKGTVLRAAVNNARKSAKGGTLYRDFGDLLGHDELAKVKPHLSKGTKVKDMPPEAQRIMEELAFTALGKQQLISAAGRPLNYLKWPILRPAYALTGFAIKQGALLKTNVANELGTAWKLAKAGDERGAAEAGARAGKYAAEYAFYAGIGYGAINEGREAVFKREEFEKEDILLGAVDQIVAAVTLNRLGDDYSRDKFVDDPIGFLLESLVPPTGLAGAAAQDIASLQGALMEGDEISDETLKRFPLFGDFYEYYYKGK